MKWNDFIVATLREEPKEAESKSHKLLLRGGYIYKLSSGIYLYTPLGWKVLYKIMNVVRDEMNKAGALEVYLSVLQPDSIWKESGRFENYGPAMYKLQDRSGKTLVLGPTHEEPITILAKSLIRSYKDLPKILYQIQVKFRDEVRPRFGPIRAKEFIMKDAYSFDIDEEGVDKSYQIMAQSYQRIFERLHLKYVCVEADPGLMGGKESQEFISFAEYGEDIIVKCPGCGYLANIQIAKGMPSVFNTNDKAGEVEYIYTPNVKTLEDVCGFLKVNAVEVIKTLIFINERNEVFAFCIRGDYELNQVKAASVTKSNELKPATADVIEKLTGAEVGFSGPYKLPLKIFVDPNIVDDKFYIAGANKTNYHIKNLNVKRDVHNYEIYDLTEVKEGDLCIKCMAKLEFLRGIEVGHIFKLGTKYTDVFKFKIPDKEGNLKDVIMGCYGIGVSRLMSAVLECTSTENSIVWPPEITPFEIEIITVNMNDKESSDFSQKIYNSLKNEGYDIFWDNRMESAGVKFNDADLIGAPLNIIIGKNFKQDGKIEIKNRLQNKSILLKENELFEYIHNFFNSEIFSG